MGNIVPFTRRPRPIADFVRVGGHHHQCEQLVVSGKLSSLRYVLNAGAIGSQKALSQTLKDRGAEIVLDTNAAEQSVPGKCGGSARFAPWADKDGPLNVGAFIAGSKTSIIEQIADFVTDTRVSVCLAPAHFLGGEQFRWFQIDRDACFALRKRLDENGGTAIAIDYPLIVTYGQLRDPGMRRTLIAGLTELPIQAVWIRVSRFGADATGTAIAHFNTAMREFHCLGLPIISDYLGGLAAAAGVCLGATSGFSSGIQANERFDASTWLGSPKSGGGSRGKTVYLPSLDRRLAADELRALFDATTASRSIFGCRDNSCCENIDAMLAHPEAHEAVQRGRLWAQFSAIPESLRPAEFFDGVLRKARLSSARATRLRNPDDDMKQKFVVANGRLLRMEKALKAAPGSSGADGFAKELGLRSISALQSAQMSKR